eukprot:TRINITY_DN33337_c0_g1_i3.p1 TRINITY_DN33337_c0_g1~~TRINITY_DN33337_c0_g1_i3.p1  ORF type:complete len:279 (+),score=104.59 TRINITY_DN33337_c0_g1_i3:175-1011(+)
MCLCCQIKSCCCGFRELQPGVFMLAVVSMMINMILLMAPYLVFPIVNQNGYQMWLLILLMADISLAIATRVSNKVLILPWLISYMIMIIITCVAAPIIIIMSGMVVEARSYSPPAGLHNETMQALSNHLPEYRDLEQEAVEAMDRYHPENLDEEDIKPMLTILVSILLPTWYIYTWVASKSLYNTLSLLEIQASSAPGARRPNRVLAWNGPPSQAQQTNHQSPTPLPWYTDPPTVNPRTSSQPAYYHPPPTLIYTSSEPSGGYSVNSTSSSYTQPRRY